MKTLVNSENLELLDISHNCIDGTFHQVQDLVYPQLRTFRVGYTQLTEEVIQGLACIVNNNAMPNLEELPTVRNDWLVRFLRMNRIKC